MSFLSIKETAEYPWLREFDKSLQAIRQREEVIRKSDPYDFQEKDQLTYKFGECESVFDIYRLYADELEYLAAYGVYLPDGSYEESIDDGICIKFVIHTLDTDKYVYKEAVVTKEDYTISRIVLKNGKRDGFSYSEQPFGDNAIILYKDGKKIKAIEW